MSGWYCFVEMIPTEKTHNSSNLYLDEQRFYLVEISSIRGFSERLTLAWFAVVTFRCRNC